MRTRRTPVRTAALGTLAATAALAAVLTPVLTAAPAPAAPSAPRLPIPDNATITVAGHGWGHGHGLSQYGAEGAARKGLSAQQIVRFYYPHTTAGTAGGSVTVLLTASIGHSTTILARSGLAVHDFGDGSTHRVPTTGPASHATRWRMSGATHGRTRVSYLTGAWHTWRTLGGNGEFRASGHPMTLVLGSTHTRYRGTLRSMAAVSADTHRITVNKVSLEGYVRGVVPREMPASWHQSALRAQAIAARTYAAFEARASTNPRFELCDSSSCQVYGGLSGEDPRSNEAVAKTAKQVRLYQGEPAFTQFSSSNGGWTAASTTPGQPYLDAHQDPYDGWIGAKFPHTWEQTVTARQIERHWPGIGNLTSISIDQRDGNGQWNGRVLKLTLHGSGGDRQLTGDDFRSALALHSTWFNLST